MLWWTYLLLILRIERWYNALLPASDDDGLIQEERWMMQENEPSHTTTSGCLHFKLDSLVERDSYLSTSSVLRIKKCRFIFYLASRDTSQNFDGRRSVYKSLLEVKDDSKSIPRRRPRRLCVRGRCCARGGGTRRRCVVVVVDDCELWILLMNSFLLSVTRLFTLYLKVP